MSDETPLFGTPLSKSIVDEQDEGSSSSFSRRNRLNQQSIVKDAQGRQRFHGAFTGGFSAGYYNTVGSVEGFQPKSFVTHRVAKTGQDGASREQFSHKPEDYMDEEDLDEFGIAPRKIRVFDQYSETNRTRDSSLRKGDEALASLLRPISISIGEKILSRLANNSTLNRFGISEADEKDIPIKSDFYGIGYKPLERRNLNQYASTDSGASLRATLKGGKQLRISGEAFGLGVLDDDEDDYIGQNQAYGYDNPKEYEFGTSKKSESEQSSKRKIKDDVDDSTSLSDLLPGFAEAQKVSSYEFLREKAYDNNTVPDDWVEPTRPESPPNFEPRTRSFPSGEGDLLSKKFTDSSDGSKKHHESDISTRSGLIHYSDLKALQSKESSNDEPRTSHREEVKTNIVRKVLQWRPCSLLCKRFNVPNPYPGDSFVGVKQADLTGEIELGKNIVVDQSTGSGQRHSSNVFQRIAPIELRKAIFDVDFTNSSFDRESKDVHGVIERSSESVNDSDADLPQVVSLEVHDRGSSGKISDSDSDIVDISSPKRQEPELIVIDSSSSSNSLQGDDNYGPALPPEVRQTSIDASPSLKRRKVKKKKHKRHKHKHRG